jgi:NifU-like protein involved in Fe-S cluster formation
MVLCLDLDLEGHHHDLTEEASFIWILVSLYHCILVFFQGLVGAPACGDVMKLQIKVDADGKIVESMFKPLAVDLQLHQARLQPNG